MRIPGLAAAAALCLVAPATAATPVPDCHGLLLGDARGDQAFVPGVPVRPSGAIDLHDVFLTGNGYDDSVNIRVADLPATSAVDDYSFVWHTDWSGSGYRELRATRSSAGTRYVLTVSNNGGVTFSRHVTTGAIFPGRGGVVRIDLPGDHTFPAVLSDVEVRATEDRSGLYSDDLGSDTAAAGQGFHQLC